MARKQVLLVLAIVIGFSLGLVADYSYASGCSSYGEGHCGEGNWEDAENPNQCQCAIYCIGEPNTIYEKEPCAI